MTRNNIVRFPGGRERSGDIPPEGGRAAGNGGLAPPGVELPTAAPRSTCARTAWGVLYGIRYALFLVLMWARGPLRFLLGLVGVPAMLALPLVAFGYEGANKGELLLLCVGAGFGAFVLAWFYDSIVITLSPEPIFLN
ncbi:MAG: hypothetical protein KDH16_06685 [Rhodocyclaceae bacterium]|nr:hypothetical protein [Rhodocyclaceae bacterium]